MGGACHERLPVPKGVRIIHLWPAGQSPAKGGSIGGLWASRNVPDGPVMIEATETEPIGAVAGVALTMGALTLWPSGPARPAVGGRCQTGPTAVESTPQMPNDERIHQLLHDFLVARLGVAAQPRLHGLARVSTGRSRENWLVDVSWSETASSLPGHPEVPSGGPGYSGPTDGDRGRPGQPVQSGGDRGRAGLSDGAPGLTGEPGGEPGRAGGDGDAAIPADGDGPQQRREALIVRLDPDGGLLETDRATEFAVLAALARSDLPAPTPRWLDATGAELGRPALLMVREPGECEYFVLNGDRPLDQRVRLARRFCDLLAHVHRLDWRALGLGEVLVDPGTHAARHELEQWRAILQRDQLEAHPELELAARWLERHAPVNTATVLVHGDYKPGNVLLVDGEPGALLDWELAHLGDPHEDLGWVTQPLRTREHLIPGAWEQEDLFDYYEELSGWRPDRHAIAWWNVLACYKTAVMQVSGLRSYVEGRADELYQPTAAVLLALLDKVEGRA